MAKRKPRGQRTTGEKVREQFARVGAVAKGRQPGSKAPATLPASATPRIKPVGTTKAPGGGTQLASRAQALTKKKQGSRRKTGR